MTTPTGKVSLSYSQTVNLSMTRLEAISQREQAATNGPWVAKPDRTPWRCAGIVAPASEEDPNDDYSPSIVVTDSGVYPPRMPDAAFIAHARQDIPWLLARIKQLTDAVGDLVQGDEYLAALEALDEPEP